MRKITLIVFPDENRAVQVLSALQALQREGRVSVRGATLVERDEDGLLLLREDTTGMLLGGGLSAVVARAPSELLAFLVRDLAPKTFALIAEVSGEWLSGIPVERLRGRLVGEWPMDAGDDVRERETTRDADAAARGAHASGSLEAGRSRS